MDVDARTPDLVAVGVDGSPSCRAALAWAAREARARGRVLHVLHCWQPPVLATPAPGMFPVPTTLNDAAAAADAVLREAAGWVRERYPEVPVQTTALRGPAGRRLVAQIRRDDLLVLGISTRHRFTARLLGSTLGHVLRHARGTVVVVLPDHCHDGVQGPVVGHVVAAVDGSATDSTVLGTAFTEAAVNGWPLTVVHARPSVPGYGSQVRLVPDNPVLHAPVTSWRARYPQVTVRHATFEGPPDEVLEHAAVGAQLLVVGSSSHPARPVRLVDQLLNTVGCPIAVAPPALLAETIPGRASRATHPVPRQELAYEF